MVNINQQILLDSILFVFAVALKFCQEFCLGAFFKIDSYAPSVNIAEHFSYVLFLLGDDCD